MYGELKIRYKATLTRKTATDGNRQDFGIAVPIKISMNQDYEFNWQQLPDDGGRIDYRLPANGDCIPMGNDFILRESHSGRPVGSLHQMNVSMLPELSIGSRGVVSHKYQSRELRNMYGEGGPISLALDGTWQVLENKFSYSFLEGIRSGWKFTTSKALGIAMGPGVAFGTITLRDPTGLDVTFSLAGAGAGVDPTKVLKYVGKALGYFFKLAARMPKKSGGFSTEDFLSGGLVIKNPFWPDGQGRMMRKQDFRGLGIFADANLVLGPIGGGVQLLIAGATPSGLFTSVVPNGGQQMGLNIGAGGYVVGVTDN